jgi:hypothetical protein
MYSIIHQSEKYNSINEQTTETVMEQISCRYLQHLLIQKTCVINRQHSRSCFPSGYLTCWPQTKAILVYCFILTWIVICYLHMKYLTTFFCFIGIGWNCKPLLLKYSFRNSHTSIFCSDVCSMYFVCLLNKTKGPKHDGQY